MDNWDKYYNLDKSVKGSIFSDTCFFEIGRRDYIA